MPKLLLAALLLTTILPAADEKSEQLFDATRKGDIPAIRELLDKGANVNSKNRYGSTPLFFACDRGNLEVVKLLVDRGANLNVKDTFYNATAFGWALSKKHEAIVTYLVEKGVDVTDAFQQSIQSGDQKLFDLALSKGKLTAGALDDALLAANFYKREEMAKALLAKSARNIEITVEPAELAAYAGKYAEGELTMTFAVKDGKLGLAQQANSFSPLAAIGKGKFRFIPQGLDFNFISDGSGKVESVKYEGRGGEVELMKTK